MSNIDAALTGLSLTRDAAAPLYAQLVARLRDLILTGAAPSGARLPASRLLAAELSVSRITVTQAYDQLKGEGYLEGRSGAGVFVAQDLPERTLQSPAIAAAPGPAPAPPAPYRPFHPGAPDLSLFPHALWARLLDRAWRAPTPALLAQPDPLGWGPLRAAIAQHLSAWRGVVAAPECVIVTAGAGDAMDLIASAVWSPGDAVIAEAPGYPPMLGALDRAGVQAHLREVDGQGLALDPADAVAARAKGAVISPSRHFPTGAVMPLHRRLALLDWAGSARVIVEDDYDSEFRYRGAPLPALASLDRAGSVIYVGSFSKVLSPALRIGFIAAPPALAARIAAAARRIGPRASLSPQPALAAFIESGEFARHIRRMRRAYLARQAALLAALRTHAADLLIAPEGQDAGMHIVAHLTPALAARFSDQEIAARGARCGLTLSPLSKFYPQGGAARGLVLGFAGFEEAAIRDGMRDFARILGETQQRRRQSAN